MNLDDLEVNGSALVAVLSGFSAYRSVALRYLSRYGLIRFDGALERGLDVTEWYLLSDWLDAMNAIISEVGANVVYDIGAAVPRYAHFPDDIDGIVSAIASIDVAYHLNHRRGGVVMYNEATLEMIEGIGHYASVRVPNERRIVVASDTPYPCRFDHGLIAAMALRFERRALTVHDDARGCRERGDSSCSYVVTW